MDIHIIDVGCGVMVLILFPEDSVFVCDCNITELNEKRVLRYLDKVIGPDVGVDVFINSHRDADHMRGIKKLHKEHPISKIWDNGVSGTTTTSNEYREYMELRRKLKSRVIEARVKWSYGDAILRCMNAQWDDYGDVNEQSLVMKVEYMGSSIMLAGDTNYRSWKENIIPNYNDARLESSILLAPHHGSISFFDDPSDEDHYYTKHIMKINPAMTLISVGPNVHDLPDEKAVQLYEKKSRGSNKGNKVYSTADKGTMRLRLKEDGSWLLKTNQ